MVIVVATSSSATNIVTVPTSTNQKDPQFTQTVRIMNFGSQQNDLRRIPVTSTISPLMFRKQFPVELGVVDIVVRVEEAKVVDVVLGVEVEMADGLIDVEVVWQKPGPDRQL